VLFLVPPRGLFDHPFGVESLRDVLPSIPTADALSNLSFPVLNLPMQVGLCLFQLYRKADNSSACISESALGQLHGLKHLDYRRHELDRAAEDATRALEGPD
jgi:hypothetical protein